MTLVEALHQILNREDHDAAELIEKALRRDGVAINCCCNVTAARTENSERMLVLDGAGGCGELRVDEIVIGVGRAPNVEGLGLEAAGVDYDRNGVKDNDRLQTSNVRIFAAGDICRSYKLTHAADAMARIAIQNALFLGRAKVSALTMPCCTYTDLEIAHIGLYEKEAEKRGIPVQTLHQELKDVDRAVLNGETQGFVKIHLRNGTDQILGATVVARHAGEIVSELTLAIVGRLGLKAVARTIHPYPTQAEAIKKVADAYNRTRLTPLVKRMFEKWLAWMR